MLCFIVPLFQEKCAPVVQHHKHQPQVLVDSQALRTTTARSRNDHQVCRHFFVLFDLGGGGNALGVDALRMLELSLASAVNLEGPVTIVTHDSFPTHEVLKKIVGKYSYTSILSVPDAEIPDDRTQWVLWVDRLKVSFLTRNLGDNVVYVEPRPNIRSRYGPGLHQGVCRLRL